MNDKEILFKYAEIKRLIGEYEEQLKELKPQVQEVILKINPDDDSKVETDFGTFSLVQKRKYTYSTETQVLEDKLKEVKETEEQTGKATYSINPYLLFKAKE
jgi:hypothetical protein